MEQNVISAKQLWAAYYKGDIPGHPFRGNQYVDVAGMHTEAPMETALEDRKKAIAAGEFINSAYGILVVPEGSSRDEEWKEHISRELAKKLEGNAEFARFASTVSGMHISGTSDLKVGVSACIRQWAISSGDSRPTSIAMQMAANELFNLGAREDHFGKKAPTAIYLAKALYQEHAEGIKAFLKAQYDATQEFLKSAKIGSLLIYRGMMRDPDTGAVKKRKIVNTEARLQPISSFSTDPIAAMQFSMGKYGVYMAAIVPRERIFSMPSTGFGCLRESEVTVLGGKLRVSAISRGNEITLNRAIQHSKDYWEKPKKAVGILLLPDEDDEDADWPKRTDDTMIPAAKRGIVTVLKAGFSPDQPRDEHGMWTDTGSNTYSNPLEATDDELFLIDKKQSVYEQDLKQKTQSGNKAYSQARLLDALKDNKVFNEGATKFLMQSTFPRIMLRESETGYLGQEATDAGKQEFVHSLISSWSITSGDSDRMAVALQRAAQDEFNLKNASIEHLGRTWNSAEEEKADQYYETFGPSFRIFLREMYDQTQHYFEEKGIKELLLARGVGKSGAVSLAGDGRTRIKGTIRAKMQPMSSFSTAPNLTVQFMEERVQTLLVAKVPVQKVLATPLTGFGCSDEHEVVVLGGNGILLSLPGHTQVPYATTVLNQLSAHEGVGRGRALRQKGNKPKEYIEIDADLKDADWLKRTWDEDVPPYGTREFFDMLRARGMSKEQFMELPLFKMRHGKFKRGLAAVLKGEGPGHPFRGNQYTEGVSGESNSESAARPVGEKQAAFVKKFEGWFKSFDPETQVMIGDRYPNLAPRYYYHRPPGREEQEEGIRAYPNRNADGSSPAIDEAFRQHVERVVWLAPEPGGYGSSMLKVDLAQLDPNDLRLTGQAEGNIWHRGDIPESAIVRPKKKRGLVAVLKGGEGSGDVEGHPFRGNQWVQMREDAGMSYTPQEVIDTARLLESRFTEKYGGPRDWKDEGDRKRAYEEGLQEYKYQVSTHDPRDWYNKDITESINVLSKYMPEIKDDATKRDVFAFLLAISSPKAAVIDNMITAAEAMSYYLKDGKIPPQPPGHTAGWVGSRTNENFVLFNKMIKKYGEKETINWVNGVHDGREIFEMRKELGLKTNSAEVRLDALYNGSYAFGPKVGPFYRNIRGVDDIVVDSWMKRAFHRHFGEFQRGTNEKGEEILSDTIGAKERRAIKDWITDIAKTTGEKKCNVQAVLWYFEQGLWEKLNTRSRFAASRFSDGAKLWAENKDKGVPYGDFIPREREGDGDTGKAAGDVVHGSDQQDAAGGGINRYRSGGKEMDGEVRGLFRILKGGPGSGNFGHAGRPGEVGGSSPSDGGGSGSEPRTLEGSGIMAQTMVPDHIHDMLEDVLTFSDPASAAALKQLGITPEEARQKIIEAREFSETAGQTKLKHIDALGNYTPERQALHNRIMDEEFAKMKFPKEGPPIMLMSGGLSASGKSTILKNDPYYSQFLTGLTVNTDDFRAKLAAADGIEKLTKEAGIYTAEANDMADMMWERLFAAKCNVLYDCTMKTSSKTLKIVDMMKARGYRVEVAFAKLPMKEAMRRASIRYLQGDRFVDPRIVAEQDGKNLATLEVLKKHVDKWQIWDTNVPFGAPAKLLEGGGK